jgi:hypothetical protein
MASQINAAFKTLQDNLQVQTIKDGLKVDTIIKDFDVLKPPEGQKVGDLLKNIAIGNTLSSNGMDLSLLVTRSLRTIDNLVVRARRSSRIGNFFAYRGCYQRKCAALVVPGSH